MYEWLMRGEKMRITALDFGIEQTYYHTGDEVVPALS